MVKWRHLNAGLQSKELGQEAMLQCNWQMSDDPIDRIHRTSTVMVGQKF
jgi:hypothetical protein